MLKRCETGHYYDPEKYDACPHCDVAPIMSPDSPFKEQPRSMPPSAPKPLEPEEIPPMAKTMLELVESMTGQKHELHHDGDKFVAISSGSPKMKQCPNGHLYVAEHITCPFCGDSEHYSGPKMKQCQNGHFYNASRATCPFCRNVA